jgi:predicted transcriptional regulator
MTKTKDYTDLFNDKAFEDVAKYIYGKKSEALTMSDIASDIDLSPQKTQSIILQLRDMQIVRKIKSKLPGQHYKWNARSVPAQLMVLVLKKK